MRLLSDRSIACSEDEFKFLITWKQQKAQFVLAHEKWIESVLQQMKEIKIGLKGYKYLDEASNFVLNSVWILQTQKLSEPIVQAW